MARCHSARHGQHLEPIPHPGAPPPAVAFLTGHSATTEEVAITRRARLLSRCLSTQDAGRCDLSRLRACGLMRLPADFPTLPSESVFESLSHITCFIPVENGSCYESYSGSFLRKKPHELASSRNGGRPSSSTDGVIRQQGLERGQDPLRPLTADEFLHAATPER